MSIRRAVAALFCMLPFTAAIACGPDFPQRLLDDRKGNLFDLPEGTFAFEAAHLLPKPEDLLRPVEGSVYDDADKAREQAEAVGLSAVELKKVQAMRAAAGDDAAAKAGAGLAPELFEYTLGAIAWKRGEKASAHTHFENVLALSPVERPRRGLWAMYMLGRTDIQTGDTSAATAAFETLRERALSGVADPTGLAVASFGEQARIEWRHGAFSPAIKLYAEQAAYGSSSGAASLLFVARSVLAHRDMLDKALDDPLSQRLLAAYLFTRSGEFGQGWPPAGTKLDPADASNTAEDGSNKSKSPTAVDVEGFLAAVERHGLNRFEGADRLAAGAYNAGRYPLAAKLAARSDSALAAWVRGKLALRSGDAESAQREYAKAAKGFPVEEDWGGDPVLETVSSPFCRVESERGLLALGRDDYVEAMTRLYSGASEYWPDAAYVAERVLTVNELKSFVDRYVPAQKPAAASNDRNRSTPATQLRALLARRLMRAGRLDEALGYFDDPAMRKKVQALIGAHQDEQAWMRVKRASALFRQAQITRADGMELFGTELGPDNSEWGGAYPAEDLPATDGKPFAGKGEASRVLASAAQPDARFHYRYIASNLAERAASLVPARSQAYAAIMCQSTQWMLDTDTASAGRIYHRYVHNGAYVKWGKDFGSKCPAPDFDDAKWLPLKQGWWQTRHWTRREWPFLIVALGVVVVLFAMRRRRARA